MKKILYALLITSIAQTGLSYIPQNGSLQLGDKIQTNQITYNRLVKRGIIMNTIMTDPDFAGELTSIYQFLNIPSTQPLPPYEEIVDALQISTNSSNATMVIEALEKAIMRYLHYNHYLFCVEGKNINIFITGIQYNWFYLSEWLNINSWISSYSSDEIRQLMAELEQLTNIASKHSWVTSARLKAKIISYRNWKANTLKAIGALSALTLGIVYKQKIGIRF
ncbi:hypothetical protein HYV10_00430 [Candidatus Dependentiae bacterium]|nr:hypothetical protein [Candidatus Dependentiae bacterium]